MIYFDNAATTPMDENVIEVMTSIMKSEYGNPSALYSTGRTARMIINESRETIAHDIGACPEEIIFTSGGTESDNSVINMIQNIGTPGKSNVVISRIEHHAILKPAVLLQQKGYEVRYVNVDQDGIVDINDLLKKIDEHTLLVSVMLANNEIGTIQPIQSICTLVREKNPSTYIQTDAVQAIGHMHVNVKELGVDYMSASAHKFNGPKGVGFLYVRKGSYVPSFALGGGQEFGFRSGTENVAGIKGMSVALKNNVDKLFSNTQKISSVVEYIINELDKEKVNYVVNGSKEKRLIGNLNISVNNADGEGLLHLMDLRGISISTGSACNSQKKEPSHVLMAIGCDENRMDGAIRISVGKNNVIDEAKILVDVIKDYTRLIQ